MAKITVNIILDKSGSMASIREKTIDSFNEYLSGLRKDKKNKYEIGVTLFDTNVDRWKQVPLSKFVDLDKEKYDPNGLTALYDAACSTINEVKKNKGKNLVVVITDGQENSSQEYTEEQFKKIVEDLDAKKNWTFVYLGANQDSWANASQWGFSVNNVADFHATDAGMKTTMSNLSRSTAAFACSASMATKNFFTEEQKDDMINC